LDWNIATVWESVVDTLPGETALVHGSVRRTYAEFDERSARLAAALAGHGLDAGSKVASYLYNSNEYLEGLFGTFKLRAVPVNVNYRYLEDELVYLLDNSDAEALLFHGALAEHVAKVRDRAPKVKIWIQVDDGSGHPLVEGALDYEQLLATCEPLERVERSGDDLYFLYTGGTTGMPKGVMWRNEDLFGVLAESVYPLVGAELPERSADGGAIAAGARDAGRSPVHLPASPLMHGTGAFTSFQALFLGGTIVTLTSRSFDAHELWQTVERERVTQMAIVGDAFAKPMVQALEDAERDGAPYDLTSLALMISSGVMWSAEVKHALMERGDFFCLDSLGSSEGVGFANSMTAKGAELPTARFTIGARAKVFQEDGREVVPGSGEVGLLAVGGFIPAGYYKDPAKSDATFREFAGARWSVPGDYAQVETDGTITLLGRGSVVINSGGEKIYPEEVEEAIKRHPAVADCLVVGVPDERFGETATAVVSVRGGEVLDEGTLASALEDLAKYKRPRRWVFVPEVKRAPNGKADYKWAKSAATDSPG